jgi:hemolysin activation/secretion protein
MAAAASPLLATPVGAQTAAPAAPAPSQVTPRDIRPETPPATTAPSPVVAPPPIEAPPGAENLTVRLADVVVEGGFPELANATGALVAPLKGTTVRGTAIYQLAADIEALYAQAGYPLVRIVLPPQSLADGGTLRLTVVDGFIESLDLAAVPARLRRPIEKLLAPLVGQTHLKMATFERRLTLVQGVPGAKVATTLARGDKPGGVKLVLKADYDAFSGQLSGDNHLGDSFDNWQLNTQVAVNSPFGRGEQAYLYVSGEPNYARAFRDDAPRRVIGGGLTWPIGSDGMTLSPEFTHSDTQPVGGAGTLPTRGIFDRYSLKLAYPLVKSRAQTLNLSLAFEYARQTLDTPLFGLRLNEDRLNVLRLGADWNGGLPWGASLYVSNTLSQGVTWLDARTAAEAAASPYGFSRFGADPTFTKAETTVSYGQAIGPKTSLQLTLRGQAALSGILPSTELFSLDGAQGVSSLTSGAVGADEGTSLRVEGVRQISWRVAGWEGRGAAYVFSAFGHARYKPAAFPGAIERAYGWGGGLRLQPGPVGKARLPTLDLELARMSSDSPVVPDETRFTVSTSYGF